MPPEYVLFVMNRLTDAGYEAYMVGGCVRDTLLRRVPNDYDISTNAKPEAVEAIFSRTIPTGIRHGTVTVLYGGRQVRGDNLSHRGQLQRPPQAGQRQLHQQPGGGPGPPRLHCKRHGHGTQPETLLTPLADRNDLKSTYCAAWESPGSASPRTRCAC